MDEYTLYESPFEITKVNGRWFEANGAKHLALLLEISKNPVKSGDDDALHYALAVFRYVSRTEKSGESQTRVTGEFRLVEAVNPQTDRFVEFPQDFPLIEESPKNQTFWIVNYHRYGGQTYSEDHTIHLGSDNRLSYGTGDFLPNRDELFPIYERGKVGYIDRTGKKVIEPQVGFSKKVFGGYFTEREFFHEDLAVAAVCRAAPQSCKIGFIDKTGKFVVAPVYVDVRQFSEGLAAFKAGDKWGYIDHAGKVVIEPQFISEGYFRNGLARQTIEKFNAVSPKWGYIDRTGKFVWKSE